MRKNRSSSSNRSAKKIMSFDGVTRMPAPYDERRTIMEVIRRMAWRRYSRFAVLATMFIFAASPTFAAELKTEKENPALKGLVNVFSKKEKPADTGLSLVSKEGSVIKKSKEAIAKSKVVEPALPKGVKKVEKYVTGFVSTVTKRSIAVEVGSDEETGVDEMLLPLGPEIKLSKIKKLSELERGDQVEVKYRQTFNEPKAKGGEPLILSTTLLEISRLRSVAEVQAEAARTVVPPQQAAAKDVKGGVL